MKKSKTDETISLDPSDWTEFETVGHRMIDDVAQFLSTIRETPIYNPITDEAKARLQQPAPLEPEGLTAVYGEFLELIRPYIFNNIHPRFWGWVNGAGDPVGVLAELLKASINTQVVGAPDASTVVEHQVLNWLKEILGFPQTASGVLVSGGSKANLIAMTVARNKKFPGNIKVDGLQSSNVQMTMYASERTHFSVQRAIEIIGLGSASLRKVEVNSDQRINIASLRAAIQKDKAAGKLPICAIGNAGTTATGAIDDLAAIADVCKEFDLWFHVDGAIGAMAALSSRVRPLLKGMDKADSIAFDLHKWMHAPYEAGCVLIKSQRDHISTFTWNATYISDKSDLHPISFMESGVQLSREFRALKLWMAFKAHGFKKFEQLIDQNIDQSDYLAELVERTPSLELLAPVSLCIVCFRYNPGQLSEEKLNELNIHIGKQLKVESLAMISEEKIDGKQSLRACTMSHRSRNEDFDFLVESVLKVGKAYLSRPRP